MVKRDPKSGAAARQRGKPVQVQPKKPWGFIAGSTVLGLLLVGVLAYAVMNSGSGFEDPVARADKQVEGVAVADTETLTANHVEGSVPYEQTPPNGGDHNASPQNCQVYEAEVPAEHALHSLEHGAVWITYRPDLPAAQVATLRGVAEGDAYVLMSPQPGQSSPVNLSAWGRRLSVDSASDERVERFVDVYTSGPQSPERGASCSGVAVTGSDPAGAAPAPARPQNGAPAPAATVQVPAG